MQECISSLVSKNKKSSTAILFISLLVTFFAYPYLDTAADQSAISNSDSKIPLIASSNGKFSYKFHLILYLFLLKLILNSFINK